MTTGEYVTVQRARASKPICVRRTHKIIYWSIQKIPTEVSQRWGDRAPFLMKRTASDINLSVLWLDLVNVYAPFHTIWCCSLYLLGIEFCIDYHSIFRLRIFLGITTSSWHKVEIGIIRGCTISITLLMTPSHGHVHNECWMWMQSARNEFHLTVTIHQSFQNQSMPVDSEGLVVFPSQLNQHQLLAIKGAH